MFQKNEWSIKLGMCVSVFGGGGGVACKPKRNYLETILAIHVDNVDKSVYFGTDLFL